MSEFVTISIAAPAAAAGAVVLAVGAAAVIAGQQVVMACADGTLALGSAIVAEVRAQQVRQQGGLRGGAATLHRLQLNFRDLTATTFGAVVEQRYNRIGRAGTLQLADGAEIRLEYTAVAPNGALLFGLHRTAGGMLEAYCSGEEGLHALHLAAMDTAEQLAKQVLGNQGYRREVQPDRQRVVYTRGRGATAEHVVLSYDKVSGSLRIDARAIDPSGRILTGKDCPDLSSLLTFFREHQTEAIAPPLLDGGSAMARHTSGVGVPTQRRKG